jgi:hypothetical protein
MSGPMGRDPKTEGRPGVAVRPIMAMKTNLWVAIVLASMACGGCGARADNQCALIYRRALAEMNQDKATMDHFGNLCTDNPPCEQDVKLQSAKCDAVTAKIPADVRRTMKDLPDACAETLRLTDECKATLDHDCDQFARAQDAVKEDLRRVPLTDMAANSCEQTRIMQENQLLNW